MNNRIPILFVIALAAFASNALAQNRERHVISATAGGVNSVNGHVTFTKAGLEPQLLTAQDDLSAGDTVTTGAASQAEILLNPGSYLRLDENSVFTLVDNSLDNLVLKLTRGSAIVEATGPDDARFQINLLTEHERMAIVRSGIYRLNVTPQSTELLVRKGRVLLSDGQLIKGGRKISFSSTPVLVAKLDKRNADSFDVWSKQRAETLAEANRKLSNRALNSYLSNNSGFDFIFGRNAWGLWTYSRVYGCYTFLPFYYGWSSPYGIYYGSYFNYYYFPRYGYPGPSGGGLIVNNPASTGGSSGVGGGPPNTGGGSGVGSVPASRPPSQAGPRDPDSGSRSINRIKDPRN